MAAPLQATDGEPSNRCEYCLSGGIGSLSTLWKKRFRSFEETNDILQVQTGWRLAVVPGIVPDYTFFELMSNKRFPATTWLRKMKELDYLEEPDMFHDVFAHVPLLANQSFVDFLEELSNIGLQYVGNDYAIEILSRVYWFTVEFGLIQEEQGLRIYGAGILSSAGETKFCLSEKPPKHPFDVQTIANTSYRKDVFQDRYFVIDSYEQLYESIPEVKAVLAEMVEKTRIQSCCCLDESSHRKIQCRQCAVPDFCV